MVVVAAAISQGCRVFVLVRNVCASVNVCEISVKMYWTEIQDLTESFIHFDY